jgi:hypothetical protein
MSVMIDPPSGWKSGFPKAIPEDEYFSEAFDINVWLIANGYPEEQTPVPYVRRWYDPDGGSA